jgi:hypothetical protein
LNLYSRCLGTIPLVLSSWSFWIRIFAFMIAH